MVLWERWVLSPPALGSQPRFRSHPAAPRGLRLRPRWKHTWGGGWGSPRPCRFTARRARPEKHGSSAGTGPGRDVPCATTGTSVHPRDGCVSPRALCVSPGWLCGPGMSVWPQGVCVSPRCVCAVHTGKVPRGQAIPEPCPNPQILHTGHTAPGPAGQMCSCTASHAPAITSEDTVVTLQGAAGTVGPAPVGGLGPNPRKSGAGRWGWNIRARNIRFAAPRSRRSCSRADRSPGGR